MLSVNRHRLGSSFFLISFLFLAGCASREAQKPAAENLSPWVESTLHRLSLREKIQQMIMPAAFGYYYSSGTDRYQSAVESVKNGKVGGLIFFQGDVLETANLINHLQQISDLPLLIGGDFEWGTAMRIRRGTRFPEAMALGATRDSSLAFEVGKAIAEEARAVGVQVDFAPVADVNVNPDNPVINTRSFGENAQLVSTLASAYAEGLRAGGVLSVGKHFPGHGDTQTDSHLNLPLIDLPRSRLDSVELFPFKRLIRTGVDGMMVAHIEVPSLQQGSALPASLSPLVINGLLRHDLGFNGLVFTDAMNMGALVHTFGADSAAVLGVEAGADVLLVPVGEDATVNAVCNAVTSGRISETRIDQSVERILAAKAGLGLVDKRTVVLDSIYEHVESPAHLTLAKQAARESITVLRNDGVLPLERAGQKKILCVVVSDMENYRTEIERPLLPWTSEPVGDYFGEQLRRRANNVQMAHLDPTTNDLDVEDLLNTATRSDLILCPIYSRARSGSGKFGLPQNIISAVDTLSSLNKPMVMIAMGSPYVLDTFQRGNAYLCSYSDCEASTESVVETMFGETPAHGKLPVTIPGLFPYGSGIDLDQEVLRRDSPESVGMRSDALGQVDSILSKAVRDSAFPGAQALVVRDGAIVYDKSFGSLQYDAGSPRVTPFTMYDLASLTKVIATTPAIMRLYDEGRIHLDDPVVQYLPEFGNHGKEHITIRNLLLHNGGLPPFKQLFLTCKTPAEVLDSVYQTEMVYRTGDSTVYSDFDFIVLGKVIERISGVALNKYVDSVFFKPLRMRFTTFVPSPVARESIAPTEYDSLFRRKLVQGVVHDENAYALGGVSGHAGLFSTTSDLAIFMQMMVSGGSYGGRQYLKPSTVKLFTTRQSENNSRALGWDTKSMTGYSSAGTLMGKMTYGHTGFTGTSVWVEPEKKIFVILLTNRVYPTRLNMKIAHIRPLVHDAVMKALR